MASCADIHQNNKTRDLLGICIIDLYIWLPLEIRHRIAASVQGER